MRTQIYEHRSGLKVVLRDIVSDVEKILWDINPILSKRTVASIKESVRERLEKEGWTGEYRLDYNFVLFERYWYVLSNRKCGTNICRSFKTTDAIYEGKYHCRDYSHSADKNSKRTWVQHG